MLYGISELIYHFWQTIFGNYGEFAQFGIFSWLTVVTVLGIIWFCIIKPLYKLLKINKRGEK